MAISYKEAGVDKEEGYKAVELMKKAVAKTQNSSVLNGLGSFGAMYELGKYENPVLVSGTDGVGTKLEVALTSKKYDTVGIDAVAMCVNDVLCHGAQPIFFLDYLACGKLDAEVAAELVSGVAEGCYQAGAALIGGETAEMPGFYPVDEYDLAGFTVGIMDKAKSVDGSKIADGDVLIGIASSGIHSNGYSLVRKIFEPNKENLSKYEDSLGCTLGEALLTPTKIYVKPVLELLKQVNVKGLSHVTGGGFIENIPRMMPEGLKVNIDEGTWDILPIFSLLEKMGNVERMSMYNTFNMGIGMVAAVAPEDADKAIEVLAGLGEKAYKIGYVTKGEGIQINLK